MGKYVRRRAWNFDGGKGEILLYSRFMDFSGIGLLGRTNRGQFLN